MTRITFDFGFQSDWLRRLDIPVEVRRTPDLRLIQRATSHDFVDVEPGRYVVTAVMPAGQELADVVDASGESAVAHLESDDEPVDAIYEFAHYFAMQRLPQISSKGFFWILSGLLRFVISKTIQTGLLPNMITGYIEHASAPEARLRFFTGNLLRGEAVLIDPPSHIERRGDSVHSIDVPPGDSPRFVQLATPGKPPLNLALPCSAQCGCKIVVRREDDRYWVEVHLGNTEADLLLSYAQNRQTDQEARVAENLLRRKMADPAAAAAGSYALLRRNDLDRLHDWTANLLANTSVTDAPAIRGEHLARTGHSVDALNAFLSIESRGLPNFSDGIRFLFERLKLWSLAGDQLPAETRDRADALFTTIERFASNLDTGKAVTTFTGADPAHPDNAVITDLPKGPGIDLASLAWGRALLPAAGRIAPAAQPGARSNDAG
jgi:hypothetical protein